MLALLILSSCGQDFNSNSFDRNVFSQTVETTSPFGKAFAVLNSQCINCHEGNYHGEWSTYDTSDQWPAAGLVTRGDFDNSIIIRRLKNYGGDMPKGGSLLTEDEIASLRTWIEAL